MKIQTHNRLTQWMAAVGLAFAVTLAGADAAAPDRAAALARAREGLARVNPTALRLAMEDMAARWPDRFADAPDRLTRTAELEERLPALREALSKDAPGALEEAQAILHFQRETLLANPLLDFDRLLLLQRGFPNAGHARGAMSGALGMAPNFASNVSVPRRGHWRDRLTVVSNLRGEPSLAPLFQPEAQRTLTDPALDFDGGRILFAMEGAAEPNWRIFELSTDGTGLRQVTPDDGADVSHFDPCYLADGNLLFTSTAGYLGLPCVFGSMEMVCLYRLDRETGRIRQLTFEQDSNWSPTPLPNGRVLYQRWEYSDIAHSNSRLLMHMNPDGTDQREYYGSGSYFPPSLFYARSVPDHPRRIVGIATGHHGTHRSGRLLLIDPSVGRQDATGVLQEIPGRGRTVEPIVRDRIVDGVWPQFLHPFPLSEQYHLVAMKPSPQALWGLYLVDVFDNLQLIVESEGDALLWPIPLRATARPPALPDRTDPARDDGTLLMVDVYEGDGLKGVPRGTVKALRIFEYYFSYRGVGGLIGSVGMDGPWDIKRPLGTVPVEPDGSAFFTVPANTPISIQALDAEGRALQLMRSWTVVQPGERASCIGCHESQNTAPPTGAPLAARRAPSALEAGWMAPARGFSFAREVQPVLDRYCIGCHDGAARDDGRTLPYLKGDRAVTDWSSGMSGSTPPGHLARGVRFSESYAQLHRFVRRPGIESDLRMLTPMDYHFNTTELGQLLRKGHHGVRLDRESRERLAVWVDLNAPFHGTWAEIVGEPAATQVRATQVRAHALRARYVPMGPTVDYEHIPDLPPYDATPEAPEPAAPAPADAIACEDWPFDADAARAMQLAAAEAAGGAGIIRKIIDLGEGPVFPPAYLGHDDNRPAVASGPLSIELLLVPGGRFVMGASDGHPDERPRAVVELEPFWMARLEISNAQYRLFDARHESRDESRHGYQFGRRGFFQDAPDQPAVRVSWTEARAFCAWLSERTGLAFDLPTEAQWEWAARAGADTAFHFGDLDSDHAPYANLADRALRAFAQCTAQGDYTQARAIANPNRYDDWIPRGDRFDDGGLVTTSVGRYRPNAWGLHDMHGNAAEWTRSAYLPYPYREDDTRNDPAHAGVERVVRGGSWRDRPHQSTASYRRPYAPFQRVFNVGFRVIAPVRSTEPPLAKSRE
jgi:formylglycine-generating enzyme required for sulfatase activity